MTTARLKYLALTTGIALISGLVPLSQAEARLVKFDVTETELVLNGAPFGTAGAYEKLRGTAYFEVDPADPRNAQIFDIDKAPKNGNGKVEFSADMYLLKPVDMAKSSKRLFFEVNNRGNKISLALMQDTPPTANNNDPTSEEDFGNGFLMRKGYVIAWVGWEGDVAPGNDRLTTTFPVATDNGVPITEKILTEYSDRNYSGGSTFTLLLSGSPSFKSYEAVSTDKSVAEAELRARPSDSPRPPFPDIPAGVPVPNDQWSFATCPNGPPGTPSTTDICLSGGFQTDMVYELSYRATGPRVMGLGYATSRDFVSFLRNKSFDDSGDPNPVYGVQTVHCQGISSSGMYYRDYLYQGFNEDEQGKRVCDSVNIHIPGVHKLYLNYRFSQPNPYSVQHRERYVPDTNFPRTYGIRTDPLTGTQDGILKRPATDPKVWHTDSSTEYWEFRSSLVDTDEDGTEDIAQPSNLRRYLYSSTQHFPRKGATPTLGSCQQLNNQTHAGIIARALLVDVDAWVRLGIDPPSSRVPRIDDGTLVPSDQASVGFPAIPGVNYNGFYNASGERDFGPDVSNNRGIITNLIPTVLSVHTVLVPKVDEFGIDVAGIRGPFVEAPVATLTGWNLRAQGYTEGDLCDLNGSYIPLYETFAERLAARDPRPSLRELYKTHRGYVKAVRAAAEALNAQRLMLPEDVVRVTLEAAQSDVLK